MARRTGEQGSAARLPARRAAAGAVARLEETTAEILALKADIARSFYRLGKLLARVRDDEMFRAKGHGTFEAYLEAEVALSRATAYKFMRIATAFDERIALRFGPEKLDAALRYIEATPADETPADVPTLDVEVVDEGGRRVTKPIAKATTREIDEATRAVSRRRRARSARVAPGAEAADRFLQRAADALDRANLEQVKVAVSPGRKGVEPTLRVERVRLGNAWRTFAVLAKVARAADV